MEYNKLVEERYSCRKFSEKPVEKDKIEKILETGILAPTAVNKQPYRIFNLESQRAKDAVRQVTDFTFGADVFLAVGSRPDEAWIRKFDDKNFADVDASIVTTHMLLAIKNQGLDSTWVGHFDEPELKKLLPEMEGYNMIAILPIGYASDDAKPAGLHYKRRKKEDTVIKL